MRILGWGACVAAAIDVFLGVKAVPEIFDGFVGGVVSSRESHRRREVRLFSAGWSVAADFLSRISAFHFKKYAIPLRQMQVFQAGSSRETGMFRF